MHTSHARTTHTSPAWTLCSIAPISPIGIPPICILAHSRPIPMGGGILPSPVLGYALRHRGETGAEGIPGGQPDGVEDPLGLSVIDEPALEQSQPTVLELRLRDLLRAPVDASVFGMGLEVRSVRQDARDIDSWIAQLDQLHTTQPPAEISYSCPLPEMDTLLAQWDPSFEALLRKCVLPDFDIDLETEEMARLCCALVDIPTGINQVESLHLLFALYSEIVSNQHFKIE
ncbi:intraflagellar transport complex B protein 46 [Kipferlia bialata]|uniref:Intraflagellar transport complex B protein 46 n=1 Tax=Kipferlia bialata TaxID=797122 RepID=A0A9K3GHD0_9EUKA|nr:intraflagellar transport complex B protein 46 [Kipferlia bialata]|eukprot:g3342.t1